MNYLSEDMIRRKALRIIPLNFILELTDEIADHDSAETVFRENNRSTLAKCICNTL